MSFRLFTQVCVTFMFFFYLFVCKHVCLVTCFFVYNHFVYIPVFFVSLLTRLHVISYV